MPLRTLIVDFNSFFASCEQQERPELRGRPVGVVPVMAETTGCIAVSVEAKQRGLKRNARVDEARRRCPGIIIVEARPALYIQYHRRLIEIIESCLHVTSVMSIDEVACDLTATFASRERAVAVARRIKAAITRGAGACLTCSIGIASNSFLAKVASDMQKPDGLVVLDDADVPRRLLDLEIGDFVGIGENMERRLRARGIDTVRKLYAATREELRAAWGGIEGERMHARLRGEEIPLPPPRHQTVGHSHVLPPELRNETAALAVLHRLLQKAAMRLRDMGLFAGGLQVSVRHREDRGWSNELRFNETQDTLQLIDALTQIWERRPARGRAPFKVGLVLFNLVELPGHTPDLFAREQEQAHERLHDVVDRLNRAYGKNTVYFGGAHGATGYAPMRIAFTRIPRPELEEIDPQQSKVIRPRKK
ncbi:MAG: hypothetical protein PHE83_14435 [Opitutaceae bacterium]|nr:hypothetical protein [Opitutaceae bacterium]